MIDKLCHDNLPQIKSINYQKNDELNNLNIILKIILKKTIYTIIIKMIIKLDIPYDDNLIGTS